MSTCAYCSNPGKLYTRSLAHEPGPVRLCDQHLYTLKACQGTCQFDYIPEPELIPTQHDAMEGRR